MCYNIYDPFGVSAIIFLFIQVSNPPSFSIYMKPVWFLSVLVLIDMKLLALKFEFHLCQ